jgi:hypothetical protein
MKLKLKLSLPLIKQHAMKIYRVVEVMLHAFLISAQVGGERSPPHPDSVIPWKKPPVPTG